MTKESIRLSQLVLMCSVFIAATSIAQDHDHGNHESATATKIKPPVVFLDKSPRIVQYQLKRLDNQRLLLVERKTDDKKYIPVYQAILSRVGMSPQLREEAVAALDDLQDSDPIAVLLETLESLDPEDRRQRRTAEQISGMLLGQPTALLKSHTDVSARQPNRTIRSRDSVGYAGLVMSDQSELALSAAQADEDTMLDFLHAVSMVPAAAKRMELLGPITSQLTQSDSIKIRRAAIRALGFVPAGQQDTFELIAPLVADATVA